MAVFGGFTGMNQAMKSSVSRQVRVKAYTEKKTIIIRKPQYNLFFQTWIFALRISRVPHKINFAKLFLTVWGFGLGCTAAHNLPECLNCCQTCCDKRLK